MAQRAESRIVVQREQDLNHRNASYRYYLRDRR